MTFAVIVFAGEAVSLRAAAQHQLPTAVIAIAQCAMAAIVQLLLGVNFYQIDWRNWTLPLVMAALTGLDFYISIRIAPAALVGLIEPLSLLPLMLGHRLLLGKPLRPKCVVALVLLMGASVATVGHWPGTVSWGALLAISLGIICSGLTTVTGEAIPLAGVPTFVFALQATLVLCSVGMGLVLGGTTMGGNASTATAWGIASLIGAGIGLFVGLAVSAFYYGIQHLGALPAGSIKILRLPTIAFLGWLLIHEAPSGVSILALIGIVIFALMAIYFSEQPHEDISFRR